MDAYGQVEAVSQRLVQNDRLIKLDTPLGKDVLLPLRATGRSRIGRDYGFTVDMVSASQTLELKQLIAQPVTLWVQQTDKSYLPHHGYVHTARRLGGDGGLLHAQIEFASWLHFLRFRKDARIWQDKSVPDILADVFNAHPQARDRFRFNLYGQLRAPLAPRSFCMQYEDDWNFVHRIMESEGLWAYFEQAEDGQSHTLVITDYNYFAGALKPGQIEFSRGSLGAGEDALSQWAGTRTLQSARYTGVTADYKSPGASKTISKDTIPNQGALPDQTEVYEYTGQYTWLDSSRGDHLATVRMEERESRAKRFHGVGSVRCLDAGRSFELANHPDHAQDEEEDRQFLTIEVQWFIENNLPAGNTRVFPGSLESRLVQMREEYEGAAATEPKTGTVSLAASAPGVGLFLTLVEAQRMGVPYRSPFEHHKPRMQIQTAIVTGPSGEEVYTDQFNRIKARFPWDRLNQGDENASCWLRVVMSDTGGRYGGVHVPRVGEEVLVDWVGGDCDRPIVVARVYNGANTPDWHSNGLLSGYRSKEYGGSGYNQMVMDDATGQNRVQLYSTSANSQLHLGYLIAQNSNSRGSYLGSGFGLTSDAYGAVRAGQGLYVSTHAKSATGQQLDVSEAHTQLSGAQDTLDALSQASETHQAESLKDGQSALKDFVSATQSGAQGLASGGNTAGGGTGSANAFSAPVMLMASPAGIGASSQQSVHVSAGQQINLVSAQNINVASGKSLVASVAQKLSLFVQNAGMKLFAAKGKVEIQAHSDNVELTGQKSVKLVSATENIEAAAKQQILLTSGGAYIRIKDGNIEIHAPGKIDIKGAQHAFAGPTSLPYSMPQLPDSVHKECLLGAHDGQDMFTGV